MIRTTNVKAGRINLDDCRYVDEATFVKWTRRIQPKRNDIVLTREAPLGEVGLLRSDESVFLGQRTMLYRANPKKLDQRFLYYSMLGPFVQGQIRSQGSGATVEHLRVPDAESFLVAYPPLEEQRRIAALLSAYDDLIANNQRRIALLESMAEEIYREWFVRMRFPGAKSAVFVKGVPTDWTHEPILNAFKFYGGATPARDNPRFWVDGDVHWYTPTDITGASSPYLEESADKCTDEGLQNCSANLFPAYSIMMTSRATIGAIGINCAPACTNQGFITCIPNQRYPLTYLYHWLKLAKPHFEMLSGGATFAELTKGTFKRIRILTPPEKLVAAYEQQARPMFEQVELLTKTNRRLRATRDALIPRLISGKLRVEALDIQFPPSMQPPPAEAAQRGEAIAS
ncbi:restriction endonuclease subunit S [Hydrogenophaga borbori]|uniref:Restriction endonuclease subunit S n=2 Tax=Hydrogenophaga borbori TaxID=2294117 RepID=A0A372EE97_9BURK|nr:restriction endonuclease subunit S [Hydrogenophaga borbori]